MRPTLRRRTAALAITMFAFATAIVCGTNFVLYRGAVQERTELLSDMVIEESRVLENHFAGDIPAATSQLDLSAEDLDLVAGRAGILGPQPDPDCRRIAALGPGDKLSLFETAGEGLRPVPADASFAGPLGRALNGWSGTSIVSDPLEGALLVVAAPISGTNAAWANVVALRTVRTPYLRAALSQSLFALAGILGGILLLVRINRALTDELETTVARLSTAQRVGRMGNWEFDVTTQKFWWSDEIYRMLGFPPGQVTDRFQAFVDCIHADDRDRVLAAVRRSVENAEPFNVRHRSVRADGVEIMVHEQGELMRGAAGEPARLIGTAQDVTEQWTAERKLDRLHAEQELIFDNSAIGIAFVKGRTIVRANGFFAQLFGYDPNAVPGRPTEDFFPDTASEIEAWDQATPLLDQGQNFDAERLMRRRDGALFWCRLTGTLVDTDDGEPHSIWLLEDISGRRLAEEKLRLSENRYELATSGIRDAAWDVDLVTGETWLSPVWQELAGLSNAEMAGYEWRRYIHPEDLPALERSLNKVLSGKSPHFWHEVRHRHRDGRWLWFECRGNVKRDDTGKAVRFSGRVTDITRRKQAEDALRKAYAEMEVRIDARTEELSRELAERKRAEAALAESEGRLKTVAELSPVGLFKADDNGYLTFVNESFLRILGLGWDEALAFGWKNSLHPDDAMWVNADWREAATLGKHWKSEFRIVAHGEEHWVYSQAGPELDTDGKVAGYVGTITDITDRKRAENLVKRSEERLRMILDNAADGIITIDAQGHIQSFNAAAEKIFGYQASETLGRNVSILMPEPYKRAHDGYLDNYMSSGAVKIIGSRRNVRGVRKDGTEFPLYLAVSEPAHQDVSIFTGIVRDMTEAVAVEQELREAKEQAEAANRAKSAFLSRMSHELRTPMNAILGFSQLLELNKGEPLGLDQGVFVEQILMSGHHLLALINEILDLSKIEAGVMAVEIEDVAPAEVIADSLALIKPAAETRNIGLINRTQGADVPMVRAGATRLKQILTNLLSNAVKYNIDNGTVTLDHAVVDGSHLRLSVRDTGRGIAAEHLSGLFEPFVRLVPDNSEIEGTGIGLTITRNLVHLMGGKITVDSTPGKGSTFSIFLLLADHAVSPPPPPPSAVIETARDPV